MATIAASDFLALTDSLGKQYAELKLTPGDTHAGNVLTGATNNAGRAQAYTDPQQVIDLLPTLYALEGAAATLYQSANALFGSALQALNKHVAGLDAFCVAQSIQVTSDFRDLANAALSSSAVKPAEVFPPSAVSLATFAVTGSGAGTYTHGAAVDTTLYGATQVQVVTTSLIGAASITVTLTLKKADGNTETKTATISSGTASGTAIDVATSADRYTDCTAVTITGGTSADGFAVKTKVLRTPAL